VHPSTRGPNLGAPWSCRGSPHDALPRRTLHARRDAMVLCRGGDSHPSCGHAHPSAQGHGYSALLLVRNVERHRRVTMRGVDAAPCVSASRPSCRAFRLQVRAHVVGLKRTPALRTGARSFWMPRHRLCEPAFEPCPTGWTGARARGVGQASAPQRINQTATGAVAAGVPHRSGNAPRA
jgi:hypothetical protein